MYSKLTPTAFLLLLVLPALLADEQLPNLPLHRRTARSVGGFFRRIFGRNKQGPFQGTANVNTLYNAQQSSYFPNYASFLTQPSEQLNTAASFADYQNQNGPISTYGGYAPSGLSSSYAPGVLSGANGNQESGLSSQADLSSYASNYGNLAASPNTQYANYAALPSNQMGSVAGNAQNVDFNKVLDNFVRSAGLSPNGDHETAASSNVEQKDGTPVFSFKKLYSFPFYLNAGEPNSNEGSYFTIPYMRKHIKRVSSDSSNQPAQPPAASSAASALMNYFGGKKLSDITKLYNNPKYLQNMPAALNASFYSPIYGNQLKKFAYLHAQQYAKQNPAAANQYSPEIHLINFPGFAQHQAPALNGPPAQHTNVMNQATNAYPTFSQPGNNQPQVQPSNNKPVIASQSAPQPTQPVQQFKPVKVNQPVHPSVTSSAISQKQQQQQQQALIQQAIQNPEAFISHYLTHQFQQQPADNSANSPSTHNNNSNKLASETAPQTDGDLADEYNGSAYYYGKPQVSVSSSTSTKVSGHKPASSSPQSSPSSNQSSSSSSAVSAQQSSNSNASA